MSILRKRLKQLLILTFVLILSLPTLIYCDDDNKVDRYSKSSILIDQMTNRVMFEKDPDAKRPLASLSKMMTFLIALEAIENKEVNKNDIITIDKDIAKVKGSSYHLKVGEKVPLYELMKGLMIVSGNDASIAIAKHISKDVNTFVQRMNDKAKELGMTNTTFVNPNGLPIYDLQNPKALPKENISTARDIAKLGKYMFDNYEKEVVSITDMQTYSYPERGFKKNNTNALLGIIPDVDGIKTGYTGNAGYCLAFSMVVDKDKNNEIRHRMIGVVLGANHKEKRTSASLSILRYGKENFSTKKVIKKDQLIGKKYIKGLEELEVTLKSEDELYATLKNTENLKSQITLKELKYPVKKGDTIGVIKYFTETGQVIGSVDIISANDVDNISFITKIKMIFTD
nr:D-alanyl-D-alanine carboxypeptidase family protein [uncultured Romboutsia sp.]